jgi:DNA-binding LacI/PurR family transcriptional regulator
MSVPAPTALICRSRFHATAAAKGVRERGLEPMKDVLVMSLESSAGQDNHADLAVVPSMDASQQVQQLGELLLEQATNPACEPQHIHVPVHVEEPALSNE